MSARLSLVLISSLFAACGGGSDSKSPDAATTDAPATNDGVVRVDPCPGTVAQTVTTTASSYVPNAINVTQGQVVRFMVGGTHDVAPLPGTDPDLVVPLGGDRCYMFTMTGTFRFKCTPHGFTGMVTVQ